MRPYAMVLRTNHMTQNIQKIFKNLKNIEPPRALEEKIFKAVALESSQKVAKKLMFVRAGIVASFGGLAYTLFVFGKAFLESDFWNLAKLMFTDTGIIAGHIGDFSISLLENLPIVEIFAILMPVFVVMMILSYYFKFTNSKKFNQVT
jgi:hypothetical protein